MTGRPGQLEILLAKPLVDSAWGGAIVGVILLPLWRPDLPTAAILLAALVIVPLGIQVVLQQTADRTARQLLRFALHGSLPAAISLCAASMLPVGLLSAILATGWMSVTAILAAAGLRRFAVRSNRFASGNQLAFDIGLVLIAIGGMWAGMWRWGIWPGGFPPIIAKLTVAHFHFAGFALPIIAGHVAANSTIRLSRFIVPMMAALTLLLAIGITYSPMLEVSSAIALACLAAATGILQLKLAFTQTPQADIMSLLSFSAVALLCGMTLAVGYAAGEYVGGWYGLSAYTGGGWLDVPTMIRFHGATLAFGYALLGMLAVSLAGGHAYSAADSR